MMQFRPSESAEKRVSYEQKTSLIGYKGGQTKNIVLRISSLLVYLLVKDECKSKSVKKTHHLLHYTEPQISSGGFHPWCCLVTVGNSERVGGGRERKAVSFPPCHVTFTVSSQYSCNANQNLSTQDIQVESYHTGFFCILYFTMISSKFQPEKAICSEDSRKVCLVLFLFFCKVPMHPPTSSFQLG